MISHIILANRKNRLYFQLYAVKRTVELNISESEIRELAANAIIIEDYPDDKYIPSCLIAGFTRLGKPLHLQVTREETSTGLIKIITIYQPSEEEWIDYIKRR